LTDLLTVFFGLGIFTANSVIREANWRVGRFSGWNLSRQGYLGLAEYAYALALYAAARGERKPDWLRHLRPDLLALFKTEGKDLARRTAHSSASSASPISFEELSAARLGLSPKADAETSDSPAPLSEHDEENTADSDDGDDDGQEYGANERSDADELFSRGVSDVASGRFEAAVKAFTESLELNPADWEVCLNRAQVYIILGNYAGAVADCTEALGYEPDEAAIYRWRAQAHLWLKDWTLALDDLDEALSIEKRDPTAHFLRGLALAGLGDYDSAITDYNKAIRSAPTFADNYLARSLAHAALGNAEQADFDLTEAIRREQTLSDPSRRAARLAGRQIDH
jgi:tetratricopeptide (TPR) repeat protein